eukprot:m.395856 g.395856  ORF g.395856 m.395856 type:complete len:77 (+) comp56401_c0_seq7:743-973(+)
MRMASSTNHFAGSCISQISWLCLRTRQCITTIALPLSKFLSRWSAVPVKDETSIDLSADSCERHLVAVASALPNAL